MVYQFFYRICILFHDYQLEYKHWRILQYIKQPNISKFFIGKQLFNEAIRKEYQFCYKMQGLNQTSTYFIIKIIFTLNRGIQITTFNKCDLYRHPYLFYLWKYDGCYVWIATNLQKIHGWFHMVWIIYTTMDVYYD